MTVPFVTKLVDKLIKPNSENMIAIKFSQWQGNT